ncbi:ATP-binding protein [Alteromonas gracilis]|uniref:ATP-binding protein n=1 Tax=Alteromonas gracilis TaxID=1479524 RepID=UPI0030CF9E41
MKAEKQLFCTSCTSELQSIRQYVKSSCEAFGLSEDKTNLVVLAVDEACANVIRHGYDYSKQGAICIEARKTNEFGIFLIKDNCPKIADADLKPLENEPLKPGGLGLRLIHDVMDSVSLIPCKEGGNQLELKIKLKG